MYVFLLHLHSGLRWIVLIALIAAIVNGIVRRHEYYNRTDRLFNMVAMMVTHIQFIFGFFLFFVSPKVTFEMGQPMSRFYSVEHTLLMLIAIAVVTIGYRRIRMSSGDGAKFRTVVRYYGVALVLMLIAIPWPFRSSLGAGWM